jgi:sarcosine oxidase/L-pipecolate oxidase
MLIKDSPTGNFIVTYHPQKQGLFLATGGSGHAFKFLPVLGEHVVDILERKPDARLRNKWKWPETEVETVETGDGSRCLGGQKELNKAYDAAKL